MIYLIVSVPDHCLPFYFKQNSKTLYDSNNLYRVTNIKKPSGEVTGLCK